MCVEEGKDQKGEPPAGDLLSLAKRIIDLGPICDSCLGRQFATLSTGMTDKERGRCVKTVMAMAASARDDRELLEILAPSFLPARLSLKKGGGAEGAGKVEDALCTVCLGELYPENLDRWARKVAKALEGIEYETFVIGTRMSGLLSENEELLLAEGGSRYAEPMKSEINREVGKRVAALTGKEGRLKDPDITAILSIERREVELQIASVFIYGRYRKLVRGIPQTRWPCRECHGRGCARCDWTGRMYEESVDELMRPALMEAAMAEDTVFHGAGREDIDARMLGTGRPFIIEAVRPRRRKMDLAGLEREINALAEGKIEVRELSFIDSRAVEKLKEAPFRKTYEALVRLGAEVPEEKLKSALKELVGSVDQRTPTRVSHRRADKHRTRNVYSTELVDMSGREARIRITGDSGLYIKELVSGDAGRTRPSLSGALGVDAVVSELDVIDVGGESDAKITRNEKGHEG